MDNRWIEAMTGQRAAEEDDIRRWVDGHRRTERRKIEEALAAQIQGASPLLQTALRLLADAGQRWTSVSGTVRSWADEEVLAVGRRLFHREGAEAGLEPQKFVARPDKGDDAVDDEEMPARSVVESRFVAAQPPFRLRLECLSQTALPEHLLSPGLVVRNGRRYWVVSGDRVESLRVVPECILRLRTGQTWWSYEDGVENATNVRLSDSYGIENLDRLLRPSSLLRAFAFQSAIGAVEAGREAIQLSAVLAPAADAMRFALELVALGPAQYTITIDASCGIVLAWMASIEGMPAHGQSMSGVQIDGPTDESAFIAPS